MQIWYFCLIIYIKKLLFSIKVQKPILQTATGVAVSAPIETASPTPYSTTPQPQVAVLTAKSSVLHGVATSVITAQPSIETCTIPAPAPPPSYEFSIQQKQQQQQQRPLPMTPSPSPVILTSNSPLPLQRNKSPASVESNNKVLPPPPPYPSSAVSGLATEGSHQQVWKGNKFKIYFL